MLRLRIESPVHGWRAFRWSVYLLTAGVAPLGLCGAFVVGGSFGTILVAVLALNYGLTVFGVEFMVRVGRQPVTFEFDPVGFRVIGPGSLVRTFAWRDLSRVRVRVGGPRTAPTAAVFQFRAGLRMAITGVDLTHHRDVAERIVTMIARYAPRVPRVGRTEIFRWDPTWAADGDETISALTFQPRFYSGMALLGPAVNLELTVAALVIGIFQEPSVALAMVVAYVVLGTVQITYFGRVVRAIVGSGGSATSERSVRVLLGAGIALVVLEGLLGVRFLLL